jgi:hypothetical protein
MKTLFCLILISSTMILPIVQNASALGVSTGGPIPRFGRLDDVSLSRQSIQTGETITITGKIVYMQQNQTQGWLTIHSDPGPYGRWSIVSTQPSEHLIDIPGNSLIPFSITVKALQPGTYHFFPEVDLVGIGPAMSSLNGNNRTEPTVTVTGEPVCMPGLVAVSKTEDGSPTCVKPQTAQKLVERGWGTYVITNSTQKQSSTILPSQLKIITGLENDAGIVTLENMTYYFETPNYTETANSYPKKLVLFFHDVVFTMVLRSGDKSLIDGCERESYWTDAKFSDGTSELLYIYVDSQPCPVHFPQISFSTHTNPKAGLTFYDGKMKLLVDAKKIQLEIKTTDFTNASMGSFTVRNIGGAIHIEPDNLFNQTVYFSGNVGQVKKGFSVNVSISDPYDMFVRKYTVSSSDIAQDGSFNFTHTFLGKYNQDTYTLDFSYGNQRLELKYNPVVPP